MLAKGVMHPAYNSTHADLLTINTQILLSTIIGGCIYPPLQMLILIS